MYDSYCNRKALRRTCQLILLEKHYSNHPETACILMDEKGWSVGLLAAAAAAAADQDLAGGAFPNPAPS